MYGIDSGNGYVYGEDETVLEERQDAEPEADNEKIDVGADDK